jgi:hypothetical protein
VRLRRPESRDLGKEGRDLKALVISPSPVDPVLLHVQIDEWPGRNSPRDLLFLALPGMQPSLKLIAKNLATFSTQ